VTRVELVLPAVLLRLIQFPINCVLAFKMVSDPLGGAGQFTTPDMEITRTT